MVIAVENHRYNTLIINNVCFHVKCYRRKHHFEIVNQIVEVVVVAVVVDDNGQFTTHIIAQFHKLSRHREQPSPIAAVDTIIFLSSTSCCCQ